MDKETAAKLLDKAAQICVSKHAGQRDKMGCAYFQHPMHVAMRCKSDEEKMVALLHDTIEDTDVTAEYLLAEGFPQEVVNGVLSVTKRDGESYEDFVARAKQNPLGRVVKLHDLEDNLDIFRLDNLTPDMFSRLAKYLASYHFLQEETMISDQRTTEEIPSDIVAEPSYKITRIVTSRADSHRQQRARINKRLASLRSTGGTEYMQNKISVVMPDWSVIAEYATYCSLIKVFEYIGFEKVAALNLKYGKFPIVTKEPPEGRTDKYAQANRTWYVISKWPTVVAAQYLNNIADALNLYIECDVVPK